MKLGQFTITMIRNDSGKFTAYVNEIPKLLVQGDNEDDIKQKLDLLLKWYVEYLKKNDAKENL